MSCVKCECPECMILRLRQENKRLSFELECMKLKTIGDMARSLRGSEDLGPESLSDEAAECPSKSVSELGYLSEIVRRHNERSAQTAETLYKHVGVVIEDIRNPPEQVDQMMGLGSIRCDVCDIVVPYNAIHFCGELK